MKSPSVCTDRTKWLKTISRLSPLRKWKKLGKTVPASGKWQVCYASCAGQSARHFSSFWNMYHLRAQNHWYAQVYTFSYTYSTVLNQFNAGLGKKNCSRQMGTGERMLCSLCSTVTFFLIICVFLWRSTLKINKASVRKPPEFCGIFKILQ